LTAVDHLLRHCGGLDRDESLVIVCDTTTRDLAEVFAQQARPLTRQVGVHEVAALEMHGQEPPSAIASAMLDADLILGMTQMSMAHTQARLAASNRGARYLSMPDYDLPLLHNPAVTTDYRAAAPRVRRFAEALDAGTHVRVTTERGTDIELNIGGRNANYCPGFVDTPGALGSPPDIEANISPVEPDSNGVIVIDGSIPCREIGLLSTPVKLTVHDGIIRDIGTSNDALHTCLTSLFARAGSDNAYILGECGIGLNPAAELTGNMLTDEGAFGCVHFGFGSNATMGGVNDVPFHLDFVLREPTLAVDGETLIDKGDVVL
jgi:leucyl aminopeptidase (aminopeptidase T)